jgi:hypothetical protein
VFAALWTFAEPLQFFGIGGSTFSRLGSVGYACLLASAILVVAISEWVLRARSKGRHFPLTVLFTCKREGKRLRLEIPRDWTGEAFVHAILSNGHGLFEEDTVKWFKWLYDPQLYLLGDRKRKLNLAKTFRELDVQDGAELVLDGKPQEIPRGCFG